MTTVAVVHNVSMQMLNSSWTTINGTCHECLCAVLMSPTSNASFNCFRNNKTCDIFSSSSITNSLSLVNNPACSVYFMSLPVVDTAWTTAIIKQSTSTFIMYETVYGIWNTTAGDRSSAATSGSGPGNYYPGETPSTVFDRNASTKYMGFGSCDLSGTHTVECGLNTGFYLTPLVGSSRIVSFRFCTGNDAPLRDPMTVTLEGSNQPFSVLTQGSSWTLIYNGSTGLNSDPGRNTYGVTQNISNSFWYESYRLLVTSKRGVAPGTQYAEILLSVY